MTNEPSNDKSNDKSNDAAPRQEPSFGQAGHPLLEKLEAFILGQLDSEESQVIEEHLEACDNCCTLIESVSSEDTLVSWVRGGAAAQADLPPLRIHAGFEILDEVGRGGMAVVYRARQVALGRMVALKQIHGGAAAPAEEVLRFRREAESIAQFDHEAIVKVFDFGEQDSQPYLAMEFLEGGTLSDHLRDAALAPQVAAKLLIRLADAVAYAHSRGVIHRDLKPVNVMFARPVESRQGEGFLDAQPKITDFGLAKRDEDAAYTQTGVIAGTPSYMAPEQTEDTSSVREPADVYSLGAILYECLTGRPPFRGATVLETLENVRSTEPVPPSRLQPQCPRDLETICLKCLEKDLQRRYPTSEALTQDLQRFVEGKPITARPASLLEKSWKWARRHPTTASLTTVVTLGLLIVGIAGWVVSGKLSVALAEKTEAQERAERNLKQARDTWNANLWNLSVKQLIDVPGTLPVRLQLLQEAIEHYESLIREGADLRGDSQRVINLIFIDLGRAQMENGDYDAAEETFQRALRQVDELNSQDPGSEDLQWLLGRARTELGLLHLRRQKSGEAAACFEHAAEVFEALCDQSDKLEYGARLTEAYDFLSQAQHAQGKTDLAKTLREKALQRASQYVSLPEFNEESTRIAGSVFHNRGLQETDSTRRTELLQSAVKLFERLVENDRDSRRDRSTLAESLLALGSETGKSNLDDGKAKIERARKLFEQLSNQFPNEADWINSQARCDYMLGALFRTARQGQEAERLLLRSLKFHQRAAAMDPDDERRKLSVAETLNHLGLVRSNHLADLKGAEENYRSALQIQREIYQRQPDSRGYALSLIATCTNFAEFLRARNKPGKALDIAEEGVVVCEKHFAKRDPSIGHVQVPIHGSHALVLQALGRFDEAAKAWERVVDLSTEPSRTGYRYARTLALAHAGKHAMASTVAAQLREAKPAAAADWYNLACIYSICSTATSEPPLQQTYRDRGFAALEQAKAAGFFQDAQMKKHSQSDPDLAALRKDPRFAVLLK